MRETKTEIAARISADFRELEQAMRASPTVGLELQEKYLDVDSQARCVDAYLSSFDAPPVFTVGIGTGDF